MDMRTVYRYENCLGRGPYNSIWFDGEQQETLQWAHCDEDHPTWSVDFNPDWYETDGVTAWRSGCASLRALQSWFKGWEDILAANGFRVVSYLVPANQVIDSDSGLQVAFRPANS